MPRKVGSNGADLDCLSLFLSSSDSSSACAVHACVSHSELGDGVIIGDSTVYFFFLL